jgi:hypothetical protein
LRSVFVQNARFSFLFPSMRHSARSLPFCNLIFRFNRTSKPEQPKKRGKMYPLTRHSIVLSPKKSTTQPDTFHRIITQEIISLYSILHKERHPCPGPAAAKPGICPLEPAVKLRKFKQ